MKSKMMKQKETETVFGRGNYMILLIGSERRGEYPCRIQS